MNLGKCVKEAKGDGAKIRTCAKTMEGCAVGKSRKAAVQIMKMMPKPIKKIVIKYQTCKKNSADDAAHATCVTDYMAKMEKMQKLAENNEYKKRGDAWRVCFDTLMQCSNEQKSEPAECLQSFKKCQQKS